MLSACDRENLLVWKSLMINDHTACLSGKYLDVRRLLCWQKDVAEVPALRSAEDLMISR